MKPATDSDDEENYNFTCVVIDGSNVIHDNKFPGKNGIGRIDPSRLMKSIEHCRKKGFEQIYVFIKEATFNVALEPKYPESVYGDATCLKELQELGILETIRAKNDDIFWLEFAVDQPAFIITNDHFNDKKRWNDDGTFEVVRKRERSLYPHLPWKQIDAALVKYKVLQGQFQAPRLPNFGEPPEPQKQRRKRPTKTKKGREPKKEGLVVKFLDRVFGYQKPERSVKKAQQQKQGKKKPQQNKEEGKKKSPAKPKPKPKKSKEKASISEIKTETQKSKSPQGKTSQGKSPRGKSPKRKSEQGKPKPKYDLDHFKKTILSHLSNGGEISLGQLGSMLSESSNESHMSFLESHGFPSNYGLKRAIEETMGDVISISKPPMYILSVVAKTQGEEE